MNIFAAVYLEKYPDEFADILTYCDHVKELITLGANWLYFDETYRTERGVHKVLLGPLKV